MKHLILGLLSSLGLAAWVPLAPADNQVTHSFLATGADTRIVDGDGKTVWQFPKSTRDGWVLANGNILLALA
ncbi:MAG TPA: hypothetical protein VEO53_07850, partial [Candidatus Binatia bacterium]|nr:hypothetical protein [Candidatus Binatia bacterium]